RSHHALQWGVRSKRVTTSQGAVRLTGEQINEAGEVLARAYADDPLMEYWEPDEAKRERWSPWFFAAGCRTEHLYGTVDTTPCTVKGAAIWLSSGQTGPHL